MVNFFSESFPFDFDDFGCQIEYGEEKPKSTSTSENHFNSGDAITDDAFQEAELYANDSPKNSRKQKPDSIENITVQIFTHICSLVDRDNRQDIEDAIADPNDPFSPSSGKKFKANAKQLSPLLEEKIEEDSPFNNRFNHSHRFRPFQRDSNFSDSDIVHPIHTQNVIRNILSALASLFLGVKLFETHKDQKSLEEMKKTLKNDYFFWSKLLKDHYTTTFQAKMHLIFQHAQELLNNRENDEKIAYYQRLTFYATLIISTVGKLLGQKVVTIVGLVASSITFLFMLTHYGSTSFKQAQQEANLKTAVDNIYHETASHRLDDPTSPS